jgi:hypothetical protein
MKISNILIALLIVLSFSCGGKSTEDKTQETATEAVDDHGHSHDANGGHSHEEGEQKEQEEFVVGETANMKTDTTLVLSANSAMEFKFRIKEGKSISYNWKSSTPIIYDFHGDPAPELGYEKGYFESFGKGKSSGETGQQMMPYDGSHGWYWKNEGSSDVEITLSTSGEYIVLGIKK